MVDLLGRLHASEEGRGAHIGDGLGMVSVCVCVCVCVCMCACMRACMYYHTIHRPMPTTECQDSSIVTVNRCGTVR